MNKQELIGAILNNIKLLNRYPMTRDNQVWLRKQAIEDLQRIYDGTARLTIWEMNIGMKTDK